ncbi:MAG: hypothetical protein OEY21_10790, partial [Nitrospira sp.]|nr:hypothetical protein [Nitrospira sp.]
VTLESALLRRDARHYWQVLVRNRGRLPHATYGLRAALAGAAGIDPDRVEVSGVETDPATGTTLQRYRAPLPDWLFGWGRGAAVSLRYFDTDAGRLTEIQTRLPPAWRLPTYATSMLIVIGMLLLAAFAAWLLRATRRLLARRRFRQQVAQAPDAHALRRLLITSTGHPTLTDWAAAQRDPASTEAAATINKACFSAATPPDCTALKQTLRRVRLL